jgi:hypothetical protein
MTRCTAVLAAATGAGYAALQWLGRTHGATRAQRRRPLPGDELCTAPQMVITHAITIDARRQVVRGADDRGRPARRTGAGPVDHPGGRLDRRRRAAPSDRGAAVWHLPDGEFRYGEMTSCSLHLDVPPER